MVIETGFTLQDLEIFLLILMRVTSFVYIAPFFATPGVPRQVKVGFSFFLTLLLYSVLPLEMPEYHGVMEYAYLVILESLAGLLIGFSAYIANTIIVFTGHMIDMEIGLAMASMFDPLTNTQTGLSARIYQGVFMILMIMTDLHHFLVRALADSFVLFHIGGMKFTGLYDAVVGFFSRYFLIGIQLVLPFMMVTLVLNIVLGILAKVAPQMNMFAVGLQIKIIVGMFLLFLLVGLIPRMSEIIFTQMRMMVSEIVKGML